MSTDLTDCTDCTDHTTDCTDYDTGQSLSYISFGVSPTVVGDGTFCICISPKVQWPKLLPRNRFPQEITNIIKTSSPRKTLLLMLFKHPAISEKPFDGNIISGIPLENFSTLYEYITELSSQLSDSPPEHWTEPPDNVYVKPIVDLTEIPAGVNWIVLGKKSRPVVINHSIKTAE